MRALLFLAGFLSVGSALVAHSGHATNDGLSSRDIEVLGYMRENDLMVRAPVAKGVKTGRITKEEPYVSGDGAPKGQLSEGSKQKIKEMLEDKVPDSMIPHKVNVYEDATADDFKNDKGTKILVDHKKQRIIMMYAEDMKNHASHIAYRFEAYPKEEGMAWDVVSDEERDDNRRDALKSQPSWSGAHRDEKNFARLKGATTDATVMWVPEEESAFEGILMKMAQSLAETHGYKVQYMDSREDKSWKGLPLKGPKIAGWETPHWVNIRDSTQPIPVLKVGAKKGSSDPDDYELWQPDKLMELAQRLLKSRQVTVITTGENNGNNGTTTTADGTADYEDYLWALSWVRYEAAATIFPFLTEMTNYTNTPLIYDAAWSIFSIVSPNVHVVSPFFAGMTSFDWLEDQMEFSTPQAKVTQYAVDAIAIGHYQTYYQKCMDALNSTGLWGNLTTLWNDLSVNNTNVVPEIATIIDTSIDYSWFVTYNESYPLLPPNGTVNGTTNATFPNITSLGNWTLVDVDANATAAKNKRHAPVKLC